MPAAQDDEHIVHAHRCQSTLTLNQGWEEGREEGTDGEVGDEEEDDVAGHPAVEEDSKGRRGGHKGVEDPAAGNGRLRPRLNGLSHCPRPHSDQV